MPEYCFFFSPLSLIVNKHLQQDNRCDVLCCIRGSDKEGSTSEGLLQKIFKHAYAPFLLSKVVRPIVIVVFAGWLCTSLAVLPKLDIGLDQELSMPDDSYLQKYFEVSYNIFCRTF